MIVGGKESRCVRSCRANLGSLQETFSERLTSTPLHPRTRLHHTRSTPKSPTINQTRQRCPTRRAHPAPHHLPEQPPVHTSPLSHRQLQCNSLPLPPTHHLHLPIHHLTPIPRTVHTLIIINKAGGLIYNRAFTTTLSTLTSNDLLILAGTFHGVHAITKSLTPSLLGMPPKERTGIEVLESSKFRLTCFQTVTGVKFLLFTEPMQPNTETIMRRCYELYADYVTKNPFYQPEMPVRCELFERHLVGYMRAK